MNVSLSPSPFRGLLASLGGVGFGVGRSLSASANAFCSRQRKNVCQAFPSRRGDRLSRIWLPLASATAQPFGAAQRPLDSMSAFRSDPIRMERSTPNHALQRTPGFGVQLPSAALIRPAQSRAVLPAMKPGTARAFALRRRAHSRAPGPESLSLGSLGRTCHTP